MAASITSKFKHMHQISKRDTLSLVFEKNINMSKEKTPPNISLEYPWQISFRLETLTCNYRLVLTSNL